MTILLKYKTDSGYRNMTSTEHFGFFYIFFYLGTVTHQDQHYAKKSSRNGRDCIVAYYAQYYSAVLLQFMCLVSCESSPNDITTNTKLSFPIQDSDGQAGMYFIWR